MVIPTTLLLLWKYNMPIKMYFYWDDNTKIIVDVYNIQLVEDDVLVTAWINNCWCTLSISNFEPIAE